jgi:hypothetical protein
MDDEKTYLVKMKYTDTIEDLKNYMRRQRLFFNILLFIYSFFALLLLANFEEIDFA